MESEKFVANVRPCLDKFAVRTKKSQPKGCKSAKPTMMQLF